MPSVSPKTNRTLRAFQRFPTHNQHLQNGSLGTSGRVPHLDLYETSSHRGVWVAPSVTPPSLDFSSGMTSGVLGSSPAPGLG